MAFELDAKHSGRLAKCVCGARIVVPIPDGKRMLTWMATAPWKQIFAFVTRGGGRGHDAETVDKMIRCFEVRRAAEFEKTRMALALEKSRKHATESFGGRVQLPVAETPETRKLREQLDRLRSITALLQLTPSAFELFVANLFRLIGRCAYAVGGVGDRGVDVEIRSSDGERLLGIAQCKRYGDTTSIPLAEIQRFAGAFLQSKARCGFFFTTGKLTRSAKTLFQNLN